jgi:hypothetical protein
VLRKIFGPKGVAQGGIANGGGGGLHSDGAGWFVVEDGRWWGHVTSVGERRNVYRFWLGKLKGRDHLKDLGVDG